jgi:hypothetical protein
MKGPKEREILTFCWTFRWSVELFECKSRSILNHLWGLDRIILPTFWNITKNIEECFLPSIHCALKRLCMKVRSYTSVSISTSITILKYCVDFGISLGNNKDVVCCFMKYSQPKVRANTKNAQQLLQNSLCIWPRVCHDSNSIKATNKSPCTWGNFLNI